MPGHTPVSIEDQDGPLTEGVVVRASAVYHPAAAGGEARRGSGKQTAQRQVMLAMARLTMRWVGRSVQYPPGMRSSAMVPPAV